MTSLAKAVGPLDGRGNLPLYQELQRALRKDIDSRLLGPDDALPSERNLPADFAVSRITVRKALDGLVADGLLVRRQGAGNFVSARVDKNFAMLTSFSEDMRARGRTPRSVWLKRAAGTVTPEEALALRLSPGTPVFRLIEFAAPTMRRWRWNTPPSSPLPCHPSRQSMPPCTRRLSVRDIARCARCSACARCSSLPTRPTC